MSDHTPATMMLPQTYRQHEVETIGLYLRAGDSCSVVGVSGMAKSNLFRHLLEHKLRPSYLGADWQHYVLLGADVHALSELTERATYDHLLDCLVNEARWGGVAGEIVERLRGLQRESSELAPQSAFVQALRFLMGSDQSLRLVIIFDQFDELYKTLSPHFFAHLRSIRDEHKYRLSFVVFTRDDLRRLCYVGEREEFYELFSAHVLSLGPYSYDDAMLLLERISQRYGRSIPSEICEKLFALTAGHAGLLKAGCMAFLHDQVMVSEEDEPTVTNLLAVGNVLTECAKIWDSLDETEQETLHEIVLGHSFAPPEPRSWAALRLKRLVTPDLGGTKLLCPLFTSYVAHSRISRNPEIKLQAGPLRIDVAGEVWLGGQRVTPPLSRKELMLLEYLCLAPGRLRTKDEITAAVYPDLYKDGESASDDALNALVKRLRDRIEQLSGGRDRVVTVRGKGYRFNAE